MLLSLCQLPFMFHYVKYQQFSSSSSKTNFLFGGVIREICKGTSFLYLPVVEQHTGIFSSNLGRTGSQKELNELKCSL